MKPWQWICGFLGSAILVAFCLNVAAQIVEWKEGPYVVRREWPHIETWRILTVLAPAAAFWFWYFARYWRGRALLLECRNVLRVAIASPLVWWLVFVTVMIVWRFVVQYDY